MSFCEVCGKHTQWPRAQEVPQPAAGSQPRPHPHAAPSPGNAAAAASPRCIALLPPASLPQTGLFGEKPASLNYHIYTAKPATAQLGA